MVRPADCGGLVLGRDVQPKGRRKERIVCMQDAGKCQLCCSWVVLRWLTCFGEGRGEGPRSGRSAGLTSSDPDKRPTELVCPGEWDCHFHLGHHRRLDLYRKEGTALRQAEPNPAAETRMNRPVGHGRAPGCEVPVSPTPISICAPTCRSASLALRLCRIYIQSTRHGPTSGCQHV